MPGLQFRAINHENHYPILAGRSSGRYIASFLALSLLGNTAKKSGRFRQVIHATLEHSCNYLTLMAASSTRRE
jgi:hypothetical protein